MSFEENFRKNREEIRSGALKLDSKPVALGVTLTTRCNSQCFMCNISEYDWDLPEKIKEELIGMLPFLKKIFWQGGEVFLYEGFRDIFEKTASFGYIEQNLVTNGQIMDLDWARRMNSDNVRFTISVDSVDKQKYEMIRRGSDFTKLLKNLDMLMSCKEKDSNSYASVMTVVMRSNYRELENIIDFASSYGFDELQLSPITGVSGEENIFDTPDKEVFEYLEKEMGRLKLYAERKNIKLLNTLPIKTLSPENNSQAGNAAAVDEADDMPFCLWPWQHLIIDISGRIRPFCFCEKEVGDMFSESLYSVWNNKKMQELRKKMFSGECRDICSRRCLSGSIPRSQFGIRAPDLS